MAELAARNKRKEAEHRLRLSMKTLANLVAGADERRPTEQKLSRQLAASKGCWESYDKAPFSYLAMLEGEEEAAQQEAYDAQYENAHQVMAEAEDLLEERRGALAAALQPPAPEVDVQYGIEKQKQLSTYESIENRVASVESCLKPAEEGDPARQACKQELEELARQLDSVSVNMQVAAGYTKEMNKLKPGKAEENVRGEAEKTLDLVERMDKLRLELAVKLSKFTTSEVNAGNVRSRPGNDTYMYQRRPMPKFDGLKRNYPAFKREWQSCITGKFDPDYEVREIKFNVPTEVEPEIKNLSTMTAVWEVLDDRYGMVMELTKELISGLQCFTFSKQATNNSLKFLEMHNEWVKVYNDLEQVNKLSVLDHEPTLCTLAKQLPSEDSKMRYTQLRLLRAEDNKRAEARAADGADPVGILSPLDIMNEFMRSERKLQVSYEQLLNLEEVTKAKKVVGRRESEPKSPDACGDCGRRGHEISDCPETADILSRRSHVSLSVMPSPCPACGGQHPFEDRRGERMYKTRLSACDAFYNMSVPERAAVVEKAEGCALCLDWTSDHQRDNCSAKANGEPFRMCDVNQGGAECGRNHNRLLHGTSVKYCFLSRRQVNVIANPPSTLASSAEEIQEQKEDVNMGAEKSRIRAQSEPLSMCKQQEEIEPNDEKAMEFPGAKEESLRVLLKNTALKLDDVLEDFTCLEEMEKTRVVFWAELSRLDMAEDEERSSGKKEEDLGTLSVRRFKRTAMTRFANSVGLLNQAKLLSSRERPAVLRADSKVGKVSSKSEEKLVAIDPVTQEKELKTEAEAVENVKILRMSEGESSSEIEFGESGPVKEEHEVRDAMVDKQVGSGGAEAQAAWQDADCDEGVRDFLKTLQ